MHAAQHSRRLTRLWRFYLLLAWCRWFTLAERKRAQSLPDRTQLFGTVAQRGRQVRGCGTMGWVSGPSAAASPFMPTASHPGVPLGIGAAPLRGPSGHRHSSKALLDCDDLVVLVVPRPSSGLCCAGSLPTRLLPSCCRLAMRCPTSWRVRWLTRCMRLPPGGRRPTQSRSSRAMWAMGWNRLLRRQPRSQLRTGGLRQSSRRRRRRRRRPTSTKCSRLRCGSRRRWWASICKSRSSCWRSSL